MTEEQNEGWHNASNPPDIAMTLKILEKLEGFNMAAMIAKKNEMKGSYVDASRTAQWLMGLWLWCSGSLQTDKESQELFEKLRNAIISKSVDEHIDVYHELNRWLHKRGIRWDNKKVYNRHNMGESTRHAEKVYGN